MKDKNLREIELSSDARVHIVDFGSVKIHTYVAPEKSFGNASHIIESDNFLTIVDSQYMIPYAKDLRMYANSLNKEIAGVIISHSHPDHYFGLSAAFTDVPTYALPEVIDEIKQGGSKMIAESKKNLGDLVPDVVTVPANALAVGEHVIDGVRFIYTNIKNAEAKTQLVIELPDQRAMIIQDLIYNGYHPWLGDNIPNWINVLIVMMRQYPDCKYLFVGHGQPTLKEAYSQMIQYLMNAENIIDASNKNKEVIFNAITSSYPNLKGKQIIPMYLEYM